MDDKLVRLSDVIETVENQCSDGNMWGNENLTLIDAHKAIDELSDIPAVDAVEVVRCRECRFCVDNWCYCVPPEKRQPAVSISGKTCWCPLVEVPKPNMVMSKEAMEAAGFET